MINRTLSIRENVSLQAYNTLGIPVSTRWLVEVSHEQDLQDALAFCRTQQCPLLVLGGGSNVVLVDDFDGLTLILNTQGIVVESATASEVLLSVAAGENWHQTVMYCVQQGWSGIENLALIPGSVGAAPIQNIGAYGVELTDCFEYLEALEIATGDMILLNKEQCEFAYRDSVFKHRLQDQVIITRVVLRLSKTPRYHLEYPALQAYFAEETDAITSAKVADAIIAIRESKLPNPRDIPNAGSFFKNPIVTTAQFEQLKQQFPNLVGFAHGQYYKLAAGWLIDQAGWKGKIVNGIAMHAQQALVLTNPNHMSGRQLLQFVEQLRQDILQRYGVELEIEPRVY